MKSIIAALSTSFLVACAPRTDIVSMDKVATAAPEEKAATCIQKNLFPANPYVRVGKDGMTVSFSRFTPGHNHVTDNVSEKVEVSVFNNRGIGDAGAGAFTVLAFGDDNDKNMVAVMENCIFESMPDALNYELQPPLPAPAGYKSLKALTNG